MNKIGIVVHGGARDETPFIRNNRSEYEKSLAEAVKLGYQILKEGGTSLNAVEAAVQLLEDNYLFNAGRGSALNNHGEVEMDAAIMEGKKLRAGAVSMVTNVRNPIHLARIVMTKTKHVLLSGYGALELAKFNEIQLENNDYFITQHQYEEFLQYQKVAIEKKIDKSGGTVGAVALDLEGNLAAATSTGGTSYSLPGRIGDSCVIGAGCYANNKTCAISGTGEGEILLEGVVAHTISMLIELKKFSLQEACDQVIKVRNKNAHIGVIAINKNAEISISFNTEVMKRGWMSSNQENIEVRIN